MLILALSIAALWAILALCWYMKFYQFFKYLKNIPGPTPIPILGNMLEVQALQKLLTRISQLKEKYGGIFKLTLSLKATSVVVADYKFLEYILGSNTLIDKSHNYKFVESWLGTGLLTGTGKKWKAHRKIIYPAFHYKILEEFIDIFKKNNKILIEKLKKEQLNSNSFDVYLYITYLALDNICESALGTEVRAQENTQSEYVKSVEDMCKIIMEKSVNPLYHYNFLYKFSNVYKREKRALDILHNATMSVIQQRKSNGNLKMPIDINDRDLGIKKKMAFLDLIMNATVDGRPLTDDEIREEVDTFMFAGHDTVGSSLSFLFHAISKCPEVQDKMVEELRTIFGKDKHRAYTYNDLQEMKYIDAVIKETLRLYPAAPFIGRSVEKSFEYEGNTIPAGTQLLLFIFGIMRDPNFFPEPNKFDPDRFLKENTASKYPYAYVPFSAGPRNCIGQKYALVEIKCILADVLRNFEILPAEPNHELQLVAEVSLKSANGINIRIKERVF